MRGLAVAVALIVLAAGLALDSTVEIKAYLAAAPRPSPSPNPKPRVFVSATPRVSHAPAYVHATARVHDPAQRLPCPSFSWIWGDDTVSTWEPHCDPYELVEDRKQLWTLWTTKPHLYRRPGTYDLAMRVVAGDQTYQASVRVIVHGTGLLADGGSR